jgi:hypothetical protein
LSIIDWSLNERMLVDPEADMSLIRWNDCHVVDLQMHLNNGRSNS